MNINNDQLDKFINDTTTTLWGLATVSDDWINQLRTYYKTDIAQITGFMWCQTMVYYLELLIARIDDLITPEQCKYIENGTMEGLIHFTALVDLNEDKEKREEFGSMLNKLLTLFKEEKTKNNYTVQETYFNIFNRNYGRIIPKELIEQYVNYKTELFEKQNLRQKIERYSI
jgi:hypothetical protein